MPEKRQAKYSDLLALWLHQMNYTHVFFVAGGNIMHLIESFSHYMKMVPVINEVAATIGAEYFNEASLVEGKKAIALVTAGPGLTNAITGIAGAFLESRELLVIGGQVKSSDLSDGSIRQSGIQEVGGVELASSISSRSVLISEPIPKSELMDLISFEPLERKGPVFLEICLDVQAKSFPIEQLGFKKSHPSSLLSFQEQNFEMTFEINSAIEMLKQAKRPVILIGSGVNIHGVPELLLELARLEIPVMTSWNAADRIGEDYPFYFGRPNNWGQRSSNLILQQSDLLIAVGTRLGFQSTGFNFEEFLPVGKLIHIDIDRNEIFKGHPHVDLPIIGDGFEAAMRICSAVDSQQVWQDWVNFCHEVRRLVPIVDPENVADTKYVEVFSFISSLSEIFGPTDIIIPGSSGGGSTVTMQVTRQKGLPQRIITNKGLASMGYGICGAIGAAFATDSRVWFIDGDGSLTQNIQELGVYSQFKLDVKIFIISNNGYASIRSTQRNYFSGNYIGCDPSTGLNLPNWKLIAEAYGVDYFQIDPENPLSDKLLDFLSVKGPALIEIPVDPDQTYYPKITSRISTEKGMVSNPLHLMTPELDAKLSKKVVKYLQL